MPTKPFHLAWFLQESSAQAWGEATVRLERLVAEYPDDGPIRLYLERCRELVAEPPGEGWDGVFVAKTK